MEVFNLDVFHVSAITNNLNSKVFYLENYIHMGNKIILMPKSIKSTFPLLSVSQRLSIKSTIDKQLFINLINNFVNFISIESTIYFTN